MHRHRPFCALAVALALVGSAAQARPTLQRLSLSEKAHGALTVRWHDDVSAMGTLRYGANEGRLDQVVDAHPMRLDPQTIVFEADLTPIESASRIFYAVGSETTGYTQPKQIDARWGLGACRSARVVFTGDSRPNRPWGTPQTWIDIQNEIRELKPDLVVSAGDLLDHGQRVEEWTAFLRDSTELMAERPFAAVIGNHDVGVSPTYMRLFNSLVGKSVGTGDRALANYAVEIGPMLLAVVDSVQVDARIADAFDEQAAWLEETLAKSTATWKVVALHHPIYTSPGLLSHSPNEMGQNRALVQVIDRQRVDLVLQGHNHWYERFGPSNCSRYEHPESATPCPTPSNESGTTYVTSGGAGATVIPMCGPGGFPGQAVCDARNHFVVIDMDGPRLRLRAVATRHQVFPRSFGAQELIDDVELKKPLKLCVGSGELGKDLGIAPVSKQRRLWPIWSAIGATIAWIAVRRVRRVSQP